MRETTIFQAERLRDRVLKFAKVVARKATAKNQIPNWDAYPAEAQRIQSDSPCGLHIDRSGKVAQTYSRTTSPGVKLGVEKERDGTCTARLSHRLYSP
jgi:hypothetical protein